MVRVPRNIDCVSLGHEPWRRKRNKAKQFLTYQLPKTLILEKEIEIGVVNYDEPIQITALSATALLINFTQTISIATNNKVMALYHQLLQNNLPWIIELVPAYCSLGIVYNLPFIKLNNSPDGLVFDWVKNELLHILTQVKTIEKADRIITEIPICFEDVLPNDLPLIANKTSLPINEIIDVFLHKTYHVFMLGFLPGFAYMGEVDNRIAIPRKNNAMPVHAGAVGITGLQAGIYPVASPGGWHVVGHTPLNIFNIKNNPPNLLKAGDGIKFKTITKDMYLQIKNEERF